MVKKMSNKTLLTKEGYQKLVDEVYDLKLKQERLITQIEEVAQPDESCEDVLATQLKAELEVVNEKIDQLEEAIEGAQIMNTVSSKDAVCVGCRVKIKISGKTEKEFDIVSPLEADPALNKISDQSPLGLALLGKKIDEEVEVEAPVGRITYKVVSIT